MLKKMNRRKKDMLVNLHYRPPMWGVESGKTPPFNHVRKKSLESGSLKVLASEWSQHQKFQEKIWEAVRMGGGFLKVLADSGLRMVPTSKVPRENLGGGCAMLGGFLKVFGLRMVPTLKVPRQNPGGGCAMLGGFLKVLADSGLRMVPTSKVPRENLGGGCAMLGGFLKVLA